MNNLYDIHLSNSITKDLGNFMCYTLKKINGMSAEKILTETKQDQSVPVDLDCIIEYLGIKKFPTSFDVLEKRQNRGSIFGLVLLYGNDIGIFYKQNDSIEQKRFVISHELGHCCFHGDILQEGYIEFLNDNDVNNEHEQVATTFAMRLLIPEIALKNQIAKLLLPSIDALSEIFQVPTTLMVERMRDLNLAYYIDGENRLVEPTL